MHSSITILSVPPTTPTCARWNYGQAFVTKIVVMIVDSGFWCRWGHMHFFLFTRGSDRTSQLLTRCKTNTSSLLLSLYCAFRRLIQPPFHCNPLTPLSVRCIFQTDVRVVAGRVSCHTCASSLASGVYRAHQRPLATSLQRFVGRCVEQVRVFTALASCDRWLAHGQPRS